MIANVIYGLDSDDPKPEFEIDREIKCNSIFDYYGVIVYDPYSNSHRVHIYSSSLEALEKYAEYETRLKSTLDPVEYDTIKNLVREAVMLRPVYYENQILCNHFQIEEILESNKNYRTEYGRY